MTVETALFAAGGWLYTQATSARDWIGRYAFAAYVVLLLALYFGDRYGPPPDNPAELAWTGMIAMIILLPWAWWFDHHRHLRERSASG